MTPDAFALLYSVIRSSWSLFLSWDLPGTHASPAEMGLFLITTYVTLRFFKRIGKVEDVGASGKSE